MTKPVGPEVTVSGRADEAIGTPGTAIIDPHQQIADNIIQGIIGDVGLDQAGHQLGVEFAEFTNTINDVLNEFSSNQGADQEFTEDISEAFDYMIQELHPAVAQVALEVLKFIESQSSEATQWNPLLQQVIPHLNDRAALLRAESESEASSILTTCDAPITGLTVAELEAGASSSPALNKAYQRYLKAKIDSDARYATRLAAAEKEWRGKFHGTATFFYRNKAYIIGADSGALQEPSKNGDGAFVPIGQPIPQGMNHAGFIFGGGFLEFESDLMEFHGIRRANQTDVDNAPAGSGIQIGDIVYI